MSDRRALWVSTSMSTKGGIATYVRDMRRTELWAQWNISHIATHRDGSAVAKVAAFLSGATRFIAEMVRRRPDVVHLHTSANASFVRKCALFWLSRLMHVPVVVHVHASDFPGFFERSPQPIRRVISATLTHADLVIALGDALAQKLQSMAPAARIVAIPNAVRLAQRVTQPTQGAPVRAVFLGRIGERKGTFRLLQAWAELTRDPAFRTAAGYPLATLTIAGDGEVERARWRIEELRVEESVVLSEWLSPEAVGNLLDSAHILVLPSRNEGQPMAVLEAMARGLCVVASDVGGLAEMIGDGAGVVVPPDDVSAIASALRLVVHDADLRARIGAAAHARVEDRFDVHSTSRRIGALYAQVSDRYSAQREPILIGHTEETLP
ncbi:glycosyltransferase family 1 protein [Mycolicibacterium moriokaense]|nr:glycosyltransferase family 1 protein [Mycolicibacterium moriokaense]